MNISWGVKIIIVFALFTLGIITTVAISMSKNVDLVSSNYYEQEIKYQSHIDLLKNSADYKDKINAELNGNEIVIHFSELKNKGKISGEIIFYRTSDSKKDFKININPDSDGIQKINSSELDRGLWKLQFKLLNNNNNYFVEKNIFLN
ncbi:MAG: FixH family protein [Ignavibacteria bacterium]|nr:FixH family protein [Ignavibacteria bacterium]